VNAQAIRKATGPASYAISLPEAGLSWEKMGPLFERYSVALVGTVDLRWAEAYKRVVATTPGLGRFRLEANLATVSFTCRSTDGPVEVMAVLKILDGMIARVNSAASLDAARLATEPEAGRAETGGARSQRGGIFARLAGNSK
jgi:hypothetical protein